MPETGIKVRVKSKEEINKTLDKENRCGFVYFNPKMYMFCEQTLTITAYFDNGAYSVKETTYNWRPEWFEVISKDTVESDIWSGTEEDIMLNLAMFHQVESGNKLNLKLLRNSIHNHTSFPAKFYGGFDYDSYPRECWLYHYPICEHAPEYRWLRLKPEFVEKIISRAVSEDRLSKLTEFPDNPRIWFPWHKTQEGAKYWDEFYRLYTEDSQTLTTLTKNERNQIKLQRKKTSIRVGTVPEGCRVHGKGCKASVRCRHLSYSARVGY